MAGMTTATRLPQSSPYAGPAFTAVSARKALGGHGSSAFAKTTPVQNSQASQPPPAKKIVWPPGVRDYVQRCFAAENQTPSISTEEMNAKLKLVISDAADRDVLYTTDWASVPLPQQMILTERVEAVKNIPNSQPLRDLFAQVRVDDTVHSPTNNVSSKKRKSSEMATDEIVDSNTTQKLPWRQVKSENVFENRITYPSQPLSKTAQKKQRRALEVAAAAEVKSNVDLERRKQRFNTGHPSPPHHSSRDDIANVSQGPVVGTCQDLEKRYFRLTAPPKAETVRPLEVLRKTYDLIKKKWKNGNNYGYACDQLKSLRQDLTVQHIKNSFTVDVYELHGRIALEKNDMGEYNQCQTQLRALYKQNLGGHPAEFLAYRILYFIYTCDRTGINDVLADLTPLDRQQSAVKHALDVRSALASGNYHRFFRLFHDTPNMGAYLIDMFVARERMAALAAVCKAYKPGIPLRMLTEELGFESDQDCAGFICDNNGEALLESKEAGVTFAAGKAGQLFEEAKVAMFRKIDIKGQI